jgi:predicted Zn-dependent protease
VPSSSPYAWQCTHADGTPVRWSTNTITVWVNGLAPTQTTALLTAEAQWTPHTEISFVPAASATAAQVVITEVENLDALPDLGPNVVEYAVTEVHQTGGYYDHATVQVANAPLLSPDTWLDTMLHELGHVAGLAHVDASDEIMRPVVGNPQTSYGDGDIAGLESERPR